MMLITTNGTQKKRPYFWSFRKLEGPKYGSNNLFTFLSSLFRENKLPTSQCFRAKFTHLPPSQALVKKLVDK